MTDITPKELRETADAIQRGDFMIIGGGGASDLTRPLRCAADQLDRLERLEDDLFELRHELSRVQTEQENRE